MPAFHQCWDQFRWILQVRIHCDDGIAWCIGQSGSDRRLKTKISTKLDQRETRIAGGTGPDNFHRAVAAAIVHQNRGPLDLSLLIENSSQTLQEFGQYSLLVKDGNDDGNSEGLH